MSAVIIASVIIVSHFAPQRLAAPGVRYRSHARICATRDGLPFGTSYELTSRSGRRLGVVVKADICGMHRIDLPTGTFRDLFGSEGIRRGIVPVRYRVIGHVSVQRRLTRHHGRHGQ